MGAESRDHINLFLDLLLQQHLSMLSGPIGSVSTVYATGQGILRVASCEFELQVRVARPSYEFELQVEMCEFQFASSIQLILCELRVSHICELNDFGFQCDLSACVCFR